MLMKEMLQINVVFSHTYFDGASVEVVEDLGTAVELGLAAGRRTDLRADGIWR